MERDNTQSEMGEEKINNANADPKDQKEQSKTDENPSGDDDGGF